MKKFLYISSKALLSAAAVSLLDDDVTAEEAVLVVFADWLCVPL